jgi:hypothetical protein
MNVAYVIAHAVNLPLMNPVKMGKWCGVPKPIGLTPKLLFADYNTANGGTLYFIDNFGPG